MSNNERRGNYRTGPQNTPNNRKSNSPETRQSRPVNEPSQPIRGNYRIDSNGNPIIPKQSGITNRDELEQDYFSRTQHTQAEGNRNREEQYQPNQVIHPIPPQSGPVQQRRVYQMDEYRRDQNESNSRANQPNSRNFDEPQSNTRERATRQQNQNLNQRRNQNLNRNQNFNRNYSGNKPSRRNQPQGSRTNWYYNLHQKVNRQMNKSSNATLPEGKTVLFAVFALIYLTMLVTGWKLMPFNKVNNLVVTGTELVPKTFVKGSSRIYKFDEVDEVMSQRQEIEATIKEENPLIESVVFNRPDWKQLEINVVEHDLVGLINQDGYHPVLNNGEILNVSGNQELANIANEALPELIGFDTSGKLTEVAQGLRQIDPNILAMMETVTSADDENKPNAIVVEMEDGNTINAIISTFAQKVQYYPDIIRQLDGQTGVINFEVGAYFTPAEDSANSVKLDNN